MSAPRAHRLLALAAALLFAAAGAPGRGAAADAASTTLDRYLAGLKSLRTAFTQTVTDAHGTQTESGAGTLVVVRPDRFRWDYRPSGDGGAVQGERGQLLVCDGSNLWFYDRDLAQVSVKPVSAALSATPVMLLSGTPDELHQSFDISADVPHEGLEWVKVHPRGAEADFSQAELGFAHDRLTRMIVSDRLGQTVQLDFSRSERNAHVDGGELQFTPPAGVDVIGKPQP